MRCGTWIRTMIARSKVLRPAVRRSRNKIVGLSIECHFGASYHYLASRQGVEPQSLLIQNQACCQLHQREMCCRVWRSFRTFPIPLFPLCGGRVEQEGIEPSSHCFPISASLLHLVVHCYI